MKAVLFVAFAALIAFAAASSVVDLTPENFDSVVDGSKSVFVEFFAPWCVPRCLPCPVLRTRPGESIATSFVLLKQSSSSCPGLFAS